MCGIVGVCAIGEQKDTERYNVQREVMIQLFTDILQETRVRGEDATGVVGLKDNGTYCLVKNAGPSISFIAEKHEGRDYRHFIDFCRGKDTDRIKSLIGHCRKSSVGNKDNVNNHPIKAGNIVGIHNGTLKNQDVIFHKLGCKRDGTVDSEAIVRLAQHLTKNGELPFTKELMANIITRLDGPAASLLLNVNNPWQVAFMKVARPMEMAFIQPLSIMIVASEKKFITAALFELNKRILYYAGNFNNKLAPISSSDISYRTIIEDYVGYIDLTHEVVEKTVASDIVEFKDTIRMAKQWESLYTPSKPSNQHYGCGADNVKTPRTQNIKKTAGNVGNNGETKDKYSGLVFCHKLGKFVSPAEAAKHDKVGPVSIKETTGEVIDITNNHNQASKSVNSNPKTDLAGGVKTDSSILKNVEDINFALTVKPCRTEIIMPKKHVVLEKEQVGVTDFLMVKVAKEATHCSSSLKRYSDSTDLAEDLGIADALSVESLPPFALANRVRDHVYKEGFIDGAQFLRKLMCDVKAGAREQAVAVAKRVSLLFANCFQRAAMYSSNNYRSSVIKSVIKENPPGITKEELNNVFSAGDLRANKTLLELEDSID